MTKAHHTIRIIAGSHRSRRIPVLNFDGLRPSGDRVRETLFNWLQSDVAGRNILDLCAGAGSLGFETASRGAKKVDMVESNQQVFRSLQKIAQDFKFANTEIFNQKAEIFLNKPSNGYHVVFLDPPFFKNLLNDLTMLALNHVNTGGFLYREAGFSQELDILPVNWELYRQKVMGQVKIELWRKLSA